MFGEEIEGVYAVDQEDWLGDMWLMVDEPNKGREALKVLRRCPELAGVAQGTKVLLLMCEFLSQFRYPTQRKVPVKPHVAGQREGRDTAHISTAPHDSVESHELTIEAPTINSAA